MPYKPGLWASLWDVFLVNDCCQRGQPTMVSANPGDVVLGCRGKQGEQATENKQANSALPWSLLRFLPPVLPWLPPMTHWNQWIKSTPPSLGCFWPCFYYNNREQSRTQRAIPPHLVFLPFLSLRFICIFFECSIEVNFCRLLNHIIVTMTKCLT